MFLVLFDKWIDGRRIDEEERVYLVANLGWKGEEKSVFRGSMLHSVTVSARLN